MRANTILSKTNTFLCLEKEQSTLVVTPMYANALSGVSIVQYLYQMMKNTMGYASIKNCEKPSYFPGNSVCQYNQDSKMCWHNTELIRMCLLLPDYTYPPVTSGLKSIFGYLAKCPTEFRCLNFQTQCLCMAQPPALPVYDTSPADKMSEFLR